MSGTSSLIAHPRASTHAARSEKNYPSLPLAHSVHLKGDYNSITTLLDVFKYDEYDWEVIEKFTII